MTSRVFAPPPPHQLVPPPPFLLAPVRTMLAARGRAGGQTRQSKHCRHAAIPQTPITTQQGRGLATAWQPHGPIRVHNNRDQRRPKKCVSVCVCVWQIHVEVIQNRAGACPRFTGSHCVVLISVSFSIMNAKFISADLLIIRVALIERHRSDS